MQEPTLESAPAPATTPDETDPPATGPAHGGPQAFAVPLPDPTTDGSAVAGPTPPGASAASARTCPTNAELHAIRQVRPITAEDLGPGPFPGGFTLEEELDFQNYVPDPIIISEERRRELAAEARKYLDELYTEVGQPTPEDWEWARSAWPGRLIARSAEDTE